MTWAGLAAPRRGNELGPGGVLGGMEGRTVLARIPKIDPRWFQIGMLSWLLFYGQLVLGFGLSWLWIGAVLATTLVVQLACGRIWNLPRFDPLSALISGIGLCTLMRTDRLEV